MNIRCFPHKEADIKHEKMGFGFMRLPLRNAENDSSVDVEQVKQKQSEAAQIMVAMKQKHPSFKTVEYFWLDDLVEKITFGRNHAMTVHWKYGGKTDVTLQIANMKDDPVYVAGLSRRKRGRGEAQNALL